MTNQLLGPDGQPVVSPRARSVSLGGNGYAASRPDRLVKFLPGFGASNRDRIRDSLTGLIAHSRHAARNNDYMKAFLGSVERHVVGSKGIALSVSLDGQINDAIKRETKRGIERAWRRWGKQGSCTVCGRRSWVKLTQLAVRLCARDGQCFIRIYRGKRFGAFGIQVQILTVDFLDLDLNQELSGGGYIDGGIECDELDRPVAYHMFRAHPQSRRSMRRDRIRVPAESIIHIGRATDAEHLLAEPWAHTALRRLSQIGDYEESALAAARAGARKLGFFVQKVQEGASPTPLGEEDERAQEVAEWDLLPMGVEPAAYDPKYPDADTAPFIKHMLRGGAAGLGMSYSALSNDLEGANFSSLRAGQGEERDEWRMLQAGLAEQLHGPIFDAFIEMALLSGKIQGLAIDDLDIVEADWRPRGWQSVNPKDDSTANESNLRNGLRSPQQILADRGEDFEDVLDQFKEAHEMAAARGLTLQFGQSASPASPSNQDEDDASEQDNDDTQNA